MLRDAHNNGALTALYRYKLANPAGAERGVMPSGPEMTHGTDRNQYARKDHASPVDNTQGNAAHGNPSWWRDVMPDWLWDNFTAYDSDVAPGGADGSYGSETIG